MSVDTKSINLSRKSVSFPQNWFSNLSSSLRLMAPSVNIQEKRQQSTEKHEEGCRSVHSRWCCIKTSLVPIDFITYLCRCNEKKKGTNNFLTIQGQPILAHVQKPFLKLILSTARPCLIRCNVPLETTLLDPRQLLCVLRGHRWIHRPHLQIESVKGNDI